MVITRDVSFGPAPKLMLNDLPDVPLPAPAAPGAAIGESLGAGAASDMDVKRLEDRLEQAKKTAAARERGFRAGIFSKVQAEQSELSVVREIRDRFLNTQAPPVSTFVFVSRLVRPEWLIEIEAWAVIS